MKRQEAEKKAEATDRLKAVRKIGCRLKAVGRKAWILALFVIPWLAIWTAEQVSGQGQQINGCSQIKAASVCSSRMDGTNPKLAGTNRFTGKNVFEKPAGAWLQDSLWGWSAVAESARFAIGGYTARADSLGSLASLMRLYFLASGFPVVDSAGARVDSIPRLKKSNNWRVVQNFRYGSVDEPTAFDIYNEPMLSPQGPYIYKHKDISGSRTWSGIRSIDWGTAGAVTIYANDDNGLKPIATFSAFAGNRAVGIAIANDDVLPDSALTVFGGGRFTGGLLVNNLRTTGKATFETRDSGKVRVVVDTLIAPYWYDAVSKMSIVPLASGWIGVDSARARLDTLARVGWARTNLASQTDSTKDAKRAEVTDTLRGKGQTGKVWTSGGKVYSWPLEVSDGYNGGVNSTGVQNYNGIKSTNGTTGGAVIFSMNDAKGQIYTIGVYPFSFGTNNTAWKILTVAGKDSMVNNAQIYSPFGKIDTFQSKNDSISIRLAAVHTVMWGGYTGAGWDSTWHRWGRRDSVDSLEASGYFKMPYLGSFGTPLLNFSGEMKINKSGAWYLGSGAVTRLIDQTDFPSPRDSVHSGFIYADTAGNRPGVIAGDTILGNARQNKYTFCGLEVQGDTIDSWQFPGADTIVIYRIDVWMITPPSDHPGTDCDTIVLKGSDSIKVALPKTQRRVVWTGRTLYKAGTNTSWVCRSVQSVGAADMSITVWYYPHAKGPGGTPWKGLASVIHPALGYALAVLALGGAALAKFKRFKKGKHETPDGPSLA